MAEADNPSRNPEWLAHRYDAVGDRFQFVRVPREQHRAIPFLTDENLPAAKSPFVLGRAAALAAAIPPAPLRYIFHSAFCCSTLLVRALDREGVAMGLSEPVLLNDIVGWRHRGPVEGARVAMVLDQGLNLLARPWQPGEAVVIKPSNLVNPLAPAMLGMRPETRALLLHAPLEDFLGSIARKGLWGRLWVRDLFVKLRREGLLEFGLQGDELLKLTDIQIAALCWLGQQRQFAALAGQFGDRIRTLDSEQLMARPADALAALAAHFTLALSAAQIDEIVGGPAFTRNSKTGGSFTADDRRADRELGLKTHADEVQKVGIWAAELARTHAIALELPAPLLG
ncbi:hypothetical protein FJQ54_16620 [Sandaracinobacter neustonicus]|uniref:Sulfotransferase domain-containing protein n=1 Tax=Sandaracinobacter neustonicus TaxID=1715348 RepID=A0A501XDR1_9SPHN|nr:hypothetical protein [Sandaracinobacter neustonicus]TPE58672.1 hypothetical protein FJQ54_16620 [Sandaracinobacter neustonicus]